MFCFLAGPGRSGLLSKGDPESMPHRRSGEGSDLVRNGGVDTDGRGNGENGREREEDHRPGGLYETGATRELTNSG